MHKDRSLAKKTDLRSAPQESFSNPVQTGDDVREGFSVGGSNPPRGPLRGSCLHREAEAYQHLDQTLPALCGARRDWSLSWLLVWRSGEE